ncbi:hypothetical protein L228DRAFT_279490 [Xylona heveae TC161]|uniref:F-box domain-containing protein n=1 Tax=Xylona heveae (strain CBS 132557 / TC161) TaxID=1328760 RepID=A0A165JHV0_XYLHT|nr:hypothetical protein L228DRAFT_279490 [Xylona heveae TC161]KZF26258.1 hypothetical protein L228DRAFT_279490 [Xylona heveae TC161]
MIAQRSSPLLCLPAELIYQILQQLPATSLSVVGATCRSLYEFVIDDRLWQALVEENLPGHRLDVPSPYTSFRELFISHFPYWFLVRNKIWFSDDVHTGRLLIARYDARRGCIEAYALVAERGSHLFQTWEFDSDVIIHTFSPRVRLHLDEASIKLDPSAYKNAGGRGLHKEVLMPTGSAAQRIFSTIFLARAIHPAAISPTTALWPPRTIPAPERVRCESQEGFHGIGHRPQTWDEVSETTFRVRKWMEFGSIGLGPVGVRMGEAVATYSTLSEELYTPTAQKPWQGIWVGDYTGHGCEFLAVMQPDTPSASAPRALSFSSDSSSASSFPDGEHNMNGSLSDENPNVPSVGNTTYSGRIEAVKLTGDINVPRGEYSFVADDIGEGGFVRIAEEDIFRGARVVRSVGHIAARGFRNDRYIPSQLILISPNRIAHYWKELGHISFYQRVDIEAFLDTA